jgi:putative aldouronate transport system substrate-binding protein
MSRKKDRPAVNRRELLALGASGLGAMALNGLPLSATRALAAGKSPLPNFYAAPVAPPDLPGDANGLEPAYTNFPKTFVSLVKEPPGKGSDVTSMVLWNSAVPTPPEKNSAWQQLNKEMNVNLKLNLVPQADYGAKWGTVMAGGDLPDLMYVSPVPQIPNVEAFTRSACADLTEYLAGDAVKAYPALANIPTGCWLSAVMGGTLRGVPIPRSRTGWQMFAQTSLIEKLGMGGQWPKNADEFKAFCKALTNPSQGRWAIGMTNDSTSGPYAMYWFSNVFGAPQNWRLNKDGTLVKNIETEEYKAALAYCRELVELGYVSPDVKSNADMSNDFYADRVVMRSNVWAYYIVGLITRGFTMKKTYRTVPPFGAKGGPGINALGPGNIGYAVLKKGSPERIKELLGVVNYLSSPIGSTEHLIAKYGVKGADWNYNDKGVPLYTEQGIQNIVSGPNVGPWGFAGSPAPFLFSPEVPEFGQFAHAEEKKFLEVGVPDPVLGHYSATDAKSGAALERLIFDGVAGIAAGRKPMSELDVLVKDWKARGGDQIRDEYQKAIAG